MQCTHSKHLGGGGEGGSGGGFGGEGDGGGGLGGCGGGDGGKGLGGTGEGDGGSGEGGRGLQSTAHAGLGVLLLACMPQMSVLQYRFSIITQASIQEMALIYVVFDTSSMRMHLGGDGVGGSGGG